VVIPIAEATPRFTGIYVSRSTVSTRARQFFASVLKGMVAEQIVLGYYSRYIDEATVKRTFKPGVGPLLNSLSTPE
jgi:polar amino acid transport system substrate-binding protein